MHDLVEVARAASETLELSELQAVALPALRRALDAPWLALTRHDGGGDAEAIAGDVEPIDPAFYFRRYRDLDPLQDAIRRTQPRVARLSVEQVVRPRAEVYVEFYRPRDVGHVLAMRLCGPSYYAPGMVLLAMFRSFSQAPFTDEHARACARILPALEAAARRSGRAEAARRARDVAETLLGRAAPRPLIALDARGRLLWMSASAEALARGLVGRGQLVPESLVDAARRVAAMASGRADDVPALSLELRAEGGRRVSAELAVARTLSGEPFVTAELRVDHPALASLTAAERQVLDAIGGGLSNAEIGRRLFVSLPTVKTHVSRVLAKLGVDSRLQAALLVRETRTNHSLV
jgi:DNA-binding NarL/FixJ family response regulator